ncbi:MAG: hypothetical protein ACYSWU_17695 [Planctomycetota bacterium]|jgi:hypothetical protein
MSRRRWFSRALLIIGSLCLPASCGKETPPRSRDEIFRERLKLPALYFTAKTHKRVMAPMSRGMFVDEQTGEICWPALACNNPECPGRKEDEPLLFIEPDAAVYVKPDGSVGYNPGRAAAGARPSGPCPECLKTRNPQTETIEQRQRYIAWVRPHVLPETAARMKQLDEELQRRIRVDRSHRVAAPSGEGESPSPHTGPQPTPADPSRRPTR